MNQLQFRGKLYDGTFLISILGVETSLCIAHVLFPESSEKCDSFEQKIKANIFLDISYLSNSQNKIDTLLKFKNETLFCPFFKDYKAPFNKTLVLREFQKNGNLENVLSNNDEIEELYLAFIIKRVLKAISKVHQMGYCNLKIKPNQIEITDDGELVFPFYYWVKDIFPSRIINDLIQFKDLVRCLLKQLNFQFQNIDNSKFSNRFKDFLKSLFQDYGFKKIMEKKLGNESNIIEFKRYKFQNPKNKEESGIK